MPAKYVLNSLDIGQGMCTFFEYYDSSGPDAAPRANALFDLGSTKSSKKAGPPTLNFLKDQIIKRKPPDGYIDVVFLSHKDGDHINLIGDLLKLLPKAGIGLVRYGGRFNWYKNREQNILTDLGKRTLDSKKNVKGFPIGHSSWDKAKNRFGDPIWEGHELAYRAYLLAANTPYKDDKIGDPEEKISARPDGDQANSKSLVIALYMGNICSVIGGDATFPTFQYINGFFTRFLVNNIMTLLPHHGSRKTTFGLPKTNAEVSDQARTVVRTYARRMRGRTVVASADTKHCHPSLETMNLFAEFTDQSKSWWSDSGLNKTHYSTAYLDIDFMTDEKIPNAYKTYQTSANVYSTLYYYQLTKPTFSYPPFGAPAKAPEMDIAFPEGMNWIYASPGEFFNTVLVGTSSNRLKETLAMLLREDFVPGGPLSEKPRDLPRAATTVSFRSARPGGARAAVALPRASSGFSRLASVA
jgi:hypothetical protein